MNQSTVKHALADIADQLDQDTRLALIKTLIDAHAAQTNRIEDTYALYREQPRVKALSDRTEYLFTPDTEFDCTRNEYVEQAREGALPGYALVDAGGRWISPGDMGWFGMSSDTPESYAAYRRQVNDYIGSLDDTTWLVALDCHI
jgi:hypothetical protein